MSPFWSLLPFSLPRNHRAEISEKVQLPRNATRMRCRDSLEGLFSLVTPVGIRADLLLHWHQHCLPHSALLLITVTHLPRPRTHEGKLAAVQQQQHIVQALPALPLQHLEDANANFEAKAAPSLGKKGCSSPSITLLVTRAAELNVGKDRGLRKSGRSETRWEWEVLVLTCSMMRQLRGT